MTNLARALGVTQRCVTDLVEALGADRLVERRPNPKDGRSTVVSLTKVGGRPAQAELAAAPDRHRPGLRGPASEQQEQLLEITPVLTEAIRKRTAARSSADA